jgi:hypothetical protein
MEPGRSYVVMASYLPLTRINSSVRFFGAVRAIRKQVADAEGLVGDTLRAKPLARDYWTLSVWSDDSALQAFMRTSPHLRLVSSLKPLRGQQGSCGGRSQRPMAGRAGSCALDRLSAS